MRYRHVVITTESSELHYFVLRTCIYSGLAAKQIAYTLQQPAMIYFHAVYVVTHAFLFVSVWNAAQLLGYALFFV